MLKEINKSQKNIPAMLDRQLIEDFFDQHLANATGTYLFSSLFLYKDKQLLKEYYTITASISMLIKLLDEDSIKNRLTFQDILN